MKKMTFLACAAMLTSAIAFTGCKGDQNAPEPSKAEEVKTEFSIALPDQVKAGPNRMPSTTVQLGGRDQFQGMTGITLVPFINQDSIKSTDTRLGDNIALGDISAASELGAASNAKVYSNVSIPLTTASFLFYAKSAKSGTNKFETGSLTAKDMANANQPADFHFDLETIITTLATATADAKAVALLAYLNSVADASDGTHAWKEYDVADPVTYDPAMAAMFVEYKKLHVLSSDGIARMMSDFYTSLYPMSTTLATNLKAAIAAGGTITGNATDGFTVALAADKTGYPDNLKLPKESVHIKWASTAFQCCSEADYTAGNHANPSQLTYPAALWYYSNSPIKTSNQSEKDNYNATNTWAQILALHDDAVAVNTRTRAVAIKNPIQYGVARLDVQVKLQDGVLEDNTPVTPQEITCASYPVTAILVGGQKNVDYNFHPIGTDVYTIYDNSMTAPTLTPATTMNATTSYSAMNSTLVLETVGGDGSDKDVRIAVELENASGKDFIGVDGCLIPAGGKFYVVANLSAAASSETNKKVFKQDYTTTAKLNLKSLKNAYNTIPDLRTPKLELGFSVDLNWTPGHTYEINID